MEEKREFEQEETMTEEPVEETKETDEAQEEPADIEQETAEGEPEAATEEKKDFSRRERRRIKKTNRSQS